MTPQHPPTSVTETKTRSRAFLGAVTGHAIEWYDYGVYGFLAVYMGALFFSSSDPAVGIIASFAVFALSFFMRPLGGLFFGPLADKIGRKTTLAIVVILMSGSTFSIGLLPTDATIGIWAPLLLVLLRSIQGFSAGGEIGTVTSFISEYAVNGRRGYATSWLMFWAVIGLILGALVANGLTLLLGAEAMLAYGWRIPFLVAGPLGLVALFIRLKLEDSPEFNRLRNSGTQSKAPLREALQWKRPILQVFAFITLHASIFYLVLTFASTYMGDTLGFNDTIRFWYVIAAGAIAAALMPLGGLFTDKFGRIPFLIIVGIAGIGAMVWFFLAAPTATPASFLAPLMACAATFGLYASSTYALMSELLPTRIRSTGIAVAYNLPVAVFGGSAPFIATAIMNATGNITTPWIFFAATGVISLIGLFTIRISDFTRAQDASPNIPEVPVYRSDDRKVTAVSA